MDLVNNVRPHQQDFKFVPPDLESFFRLLLKLLGLATGIGTALLVLIELYISFQEIMN